MVIRTGGPYSQELTELIQYWYLYDYDLWESESLGGSLIQGHEADWESVTVGIGESGPLFIAGSAHCGGSWIPFERGSSVRLEGPGGPRPLILVAEGSQANYLVDTGGDVASGWASCENLPTKAAAVLTDIGSAYRIRDRLNPARLIVDPEQISIGDTSPIVRFPGLWGTRGKIAFDLLSGKEYLIKKHETGPGPIGTRKLWRNPLQTIFGPGGWHQA